jgi:ElaA protein
MAADKVLYYHCLPFSRLSIQELYGLLKIRQEVFIVEQNCPYLDTDDKDASCHHLIGTDKHGRIHAYSRLMPTGVSYPQYASIGRVVTSEAIRRQGEGRRLMAESLKWMKQLFPGQHIKISAQCYLITFYESLGFEITGEEYLEDGIPHIAMIYSR